MATTQTSNYGVTEIAELSQLDEDQRQVAARTRGRGVERSHHYEVPFVPLTLAARQSATFTVNCLPPRPVPFSAGCESVRTPSSSPGSGLGQALVYSYVAGGITTTVQNNGGLNFPPVSVGQTSTLAFQITNNGTAAGSVNSISVGATQPAGSAPLFSITQAPPLPATIGPGETLSFTVSFTPTAVGSIAGVLRIDGLTFPVSGVANPPAAMPDYRFTGAAGAQQPLQQVATGLTLASPYALNLNGTLTLTFNSDVFSNDPAVQFAIGGRTVNFTIPGRVHAGRISKQRDTVASPDRHGSRHDHADALVHYRRRHQSDAGNSSRRSI